MRPARHDERAVGDLDDLLVVGGRDQHPDALGGERRASIGRARRARRRRRRASARSSRAAATRARASARGRPSAGCRPRASPIGCIGSLRERIESSLVPAPVRARLGAAASMKTLNRASRGQDGAATFSATGRTAKIASRLRSAGTKPMPRAIDFAGPFAGAGCPSTRDLAGVELAQPEHRLRDLRRAGAELAVERHDLARKTVSVDVRRSARRASRRGSRPPARRRAPTSGPAGG